MGWQKVRHEAKSLQSCPTLCDPTGPPSSAIPGILQARTQEWVAIAFSDRIARSGLVVSIGGARIIPAVLFVLARP